MGRKIKLGSGLRKNKTKREEIIEGKDVLIKVRKVKIF